MAQGSFSAQVRAFTDKAKERMDIVHRESAQRVVEVMQRDRSMGGNLRVDTGYLRASLVATTTGILPPVTFKPEGVSSFSYNPGPINLVILNADIKDPITVVYTANYSTAREYGSRGQPGDRWVALAAQQWQAVVNGVVAEVTARTGG